MTGPFVPGGRAALDRVEAAIWSQVPNLGSRDPVVAASAMEVIRAAVETYTEYAAGPIVAARRRTLLRAGATAAAVTGNPAGEPELAERLTA